MDLFFLDYLFKLSFCLPFFIVITFSSFLYFSHMFAFIVFFFSRDVIQFGSQWVSHFFLNHIPIWMIIFINVHFLFSSSQIKII